MNQILVVYIAFNCIILIGWDFYGEASGLMWFYCFGVTWLIVILCVGQYLYCNRGMLPQTSILFFCLYYSL